MPWAYQHDPSRDGETVGVITNLRFISLVLSDCGPVGLKVAVGKGAKRKLKGVRTTAVRLVLCALARRSHYTRLNSFPTIETISTDTGLDKNTVMLAIRSSKRQGWVEVQTGPHANRRRKSGHRAPHRYQLTLPKVIQGNVNKVLPGYRNHYWEPRNIMPLKKANGVFPNQTMHSLPESDNAISD